MKWFGKKTKKATSDPESAWQQALAGAYQAAKVLLAKPDCPVLEVQEGCTYYDYCVNPLCPAVPRRSCQWLKKAMPCMVCGSSEEGEGKPGAPFVPRYRRYGWVHLSCLSTWVAEHPDADKDTLREAKATLVAHGLMEDPYGEGSQAKQAQP